MPDPDVISPAIAKRIDAAAETLAVVEVYDDVIEALTDLVRAALADQREQVLNEAQRAVVEACEACGGAGYTIGVKTGYGHACDWTEESCYHNCPVPMPEQTQEPCEYCGRPSMAIMALLPAAPPVEEKA